MSTWGSVSYAQHRHQGLAAARQLVGALSAGWRPTPIAAPFHLQQGESCFVREQVQVLQYLEGDGRYVHRSRVGFGAAGMAMVAAAAIGNSSRRRAAERDAQGRFRVIEQGTLFLTDQRFAIQGTRQWIDVWFPTVRMSTSDGEAITLHITDHAPTQLRVWPPDYHFALFRWLAYGELAHPPAF